ncbi:alpha/beta-hydrolase [Anaeromyces robustus]|uniref:Alpha/beta-hydrolase n=1 Tax=Anaeromyces robustus TaxID=1754192 RepID=A0A1Y1XIX0_9FUNG|nr:alpha/beta-hydrolase [Anaeromyces robustus]|eukprot:ORX85705.1 alpha/beta-hydrolase [Anaeromyces robustus]
MVYENINSIQQYNFQINRVLTYGELACDMEVVREKCKNIKTFDEWIEVWNSIGETSKQKNNYLKAAYAFRMAEFFMKSTDSKKEKIYKECIDCFYKAFDNELHIPYKKYSIPFENKVLNCIRMTPKSSKGILLVCGGYDSFIEEFVFQVYDLVQQGYDIILFEGPGQGECLLYKLYFRYNFEDATSAILNYFNIQKCAMIGISWGGYFAMRSAAFEKRIEAVIAYDVLDNGFEVMTNIFPSLICKIVRHAYTHKKITFLNNIVKFLMKKSVIADWAFSQGMYITGTSTPYEFYTNLSKHTLNDITDKITQDVLLLAGEKDHYVPIQQYYRLKENLSNAHSLTCKLFTVKEGGEQHCQIGNHHIAIDYIVCWLNDTFMKNEN